MDANRPEVVAPAGSLSSLQAAVLYGADAVYFGGRQFGLRSGAENLSHPDICHGVAFAHRYGCRAYCVLNGFLFDHDLVHLPEFVSFLAEDAGVDAVIVSDLGVLETVKQTHPSLPIHLSTQASCLNVPSARLWRDCGVRRIVMARELDLAEVSNIQEEAKIDTEVFIHGALCTAYSGSCVISNYTAGRDSNRGGCKQSCRFPFSVHKSSGEKTEESFMLSSRDLRGLSHVYAAARHGIKALKIEGRMKSLLYVATTLRSYAWAVRAASTLSSEEWATESPLWDTALEMMPHRPYCSGSLASAAQEESIVGHDSHSLQGAAYGGDVIDIDEERGIYIQVRNQICSGDGLDLIPFSGPTVSLESHAMHRSHGTFIEKAHAGMVIVLPWIEGAAIGQVVRLRTQQRIKQEAQAVLHAQ